MTRTAITLSTLFALYTTTASAGPCLTLGVFTGGGPDHHLDAVEKMVATGRFDTVQLFGRYQLSAMQHVDVTMMAWSSAPPDLHSPERGVVGDAIAAYIEAGGGVLITQNALSRGVAPSGGFSQYQPMYSVSNCPYYEPDALQLDVPAEDPLFAGIDSLSMSLYTRTSCMEFGIADDAILHASFEDGRPFVVSMGSVVAINVYFASTDAHPDRTGPGYPESRNSLIREPFQIQQFLVHSR
mgnify:CR=1 FL=1